MDSKFFKGLLAVIIATIATALSISGVGVWYYVVMVIGVVITYFAQNALIKPISVFGTIDLTDVLKGALMAVGTAITTFAATIITATILDWKVLLSTAGTAFLAYLTKNLFSNSQGVIGVESK